MSNKTKFLGIKQQQQQQPPPPPQITDNSGLPPRYQPPPIPPSTQQQQQGGILKHKEAQKLLHPQHKIPENVKLPYTDPKYYQQTANKQFLTDPRQNRPLLDEPGVPQIPQHRQLRYEDDFIRSEMLKFVRKPIPATEEQRLTGQEQRVQAILMELRQLKEANQHLADDNQELRDLCCFLDDDRQKGRKLAREWQRFGRYTASVMRQEVSAYQNKLRELDNKQQELIKDNLELKELCLYLDEERGGNSLCPSCNTATVTGNLRDDGDGSSSSTNADEPTLPSQTPGGGGSSTGVQTNGGSVVAGQTRRSASRERLLHENLARQRSTFNDQIMQYVRNLEQRVKQLEDDKRALTHKINQIATTTGDSSIAVPPDSTMGTLSGRPEAVVRALQVLEVREQLERDNRLVDRVENMSDTTSQDMDDGEKALVREMCNVVWRKLEEGPQSTRR